MHQTNGIAGTSDSWDAYLRWNGAIADAVYGPHVSGVPVYMDPEGEVLRSAAEAIGADVGNPRAALLETLRRTLNPPSHQAGIFGSHVARLKRWRPESGDPPPVIGLLAVLCLAAEDMSESDGLAANNYYDRLMPLLGVTSATDKERVVRSYRRVSFDLWESLNGWLESLHGERGLPTAYSYSHAHIGRPLSQALIREADRAKLDEFFSELGLEQRSRLSPTDMEPLLTAWINRLPSPASHQIQALWKRQGARERIAEITCQLLETWEPSLGVDSSGSQSQPPGRRSTLRLLALMRTFPSPALELNLVGPDVHGERVARLMDATDGTDLGIDLALDDLPDRRWRLADVAELESRSLAEGAIRLRFASGAMLDRRPRRVVPLRKDDLLQAFIEVERLSLGEDGMVLCAAPLAAVVEDGLTRISRPGFRRVDPSPPGCPAGWVLFTHVQVFAPLFAATPANGGDWPVDLNVLQPLATSQLILQGGLQLPGRVRRWSSLAPPEIRAMGESVDGLGVVVDRVGAFQGATRVLERESAEPFIVVDPHSMSLPDGDYDLAAIAILKDSKARTLNTTRLRLRSGSAPNPAPGGRPPLVRPLDPATLGTLSAVSWDGESAAVRGALVSPATRGPVKLRQADAGVPEWWHRRRDPSQQHHAGDDSRPRVSLARAATSDCFQTGAHYWMLPPYYGKATTATIEGFCKQCGLVERFPGSYYRLRKHGGSNKRKVVAPPTFHVSDLAPVLSRSDVTPDIALDALTHLLSGPGSWLEQLSLQVEPSQLFVDRFIRALDLLAHVEVRRDEQTWAPIEWEVLPSTLVELASRGYVLCGQRSRRIEDALRGAASRVGVQIERTAQGLAAPDRVLVAVNSTSDAMSIAELARTMAGVDIGVVDDAARRVASALPRLATVVDSVPRQAMIGARSVRRWSNDTAWWVHVGDASVPGVYHLLSPTSVYCIRDQLDVEGGTMRRVDVRLAKHAAALAEGERMVGYDGETQSLYVPLGADLPGLYGRAAVLCSGLLPMEDERQRVTRYHAVPRDIAQHIVALLSARSEVAW